MKIEFAPDSAMRIVPETSVEAMALKYWEKEFEEHGTKMLTVVNQVPVRLPHNPTA
jgi:hypothetical protein